MSWLHRAGHIRLRLVVLVAAVILAPLDASPQAAPPHEATQRPCSFFVAPNGDDLGSGDVSDPLATIQRAVDAVPATGCIVTVEPGIYRESVNIKRRFLAPLVIKASDPYTAIVESSSTVIDFDGARNVAFEGFELRHRGPGATGFVVNIDRGPNGVWSHSITLRNNIIHDSYDNDLLKIHAGVKNTVVEGNIFYNQGDSEQHMDVNSVSDIVIQDNMFFNDFAGSGREVESSKHFIVVKDSGTADDGIEGAQRITVRRNVFMNWQGGREAFIAIGNDGKPYFEANRVQIESNLFLGNTEYATVAPLAVNGAEKIAFINNTVVGDLPGGAFGFRADKKGDNRNNRDVVLSNNIWSDPTGSMSKFSAGNPTYTSGLILDNNIYWNGGAAIPDGDVSSPSEDPHHNFADPQLASNPAPMVVPYWTGSSFLSGNRLIRDEFIRITRDHVTISDTSPAVNSADRTCLAGTDIWGRKRTQQADIGAWESKRSDPLETDDLWSRNPGLAAGGIEALGNGRVVFGCAETIDEIDGPGNTLAPCHYAVPSDERPTRHCVI